MADEILIHADTLSGEDAVRAWLARLGIHMTAPHSQTPSTGKRSREAMRS
jgi:hypothetical protein